MTPMLVFFFNVPPLTAVSSDLVASAVMKPVGGMVHLRRGTVNLKLVGWLCVGSVPAAFCGVLVLRAFGDSEGAQNGIKYALGVAILFSAFMLLVRAYLRLLERARTRDGRGEPLPQTRPERAVRPVPTVLLGIVGGLIVGMTSVGSGSLIIIGLMMLYPGLKASQLVGTDLVQAVPLVLSAAITHVMVTGVDFEILIPLILGGTPGTYIGARIANRVPQGIVRRGIVVVLTLTGLTLLGVEPVAVGLIAAGMVILGPIAWALVRNRIGVPEGVDLFAEKRDVERARRASEETG